MSDETFGTYDFGLTAEQEQRAARLHSESIIIDLLYWGPIGYRMYSQKQEEECVRAYEAGGLPAAWDASVRTALSLALEEDYRGHWAASGITGGSRDLGFAQDLWPTTMAMQTSIFDHQPWLTKALTAADFRQAKADGGHAGFLNSQHVGQFTVEMVEPAYHMGLRMFMPAYNVMNHLCAGCTERTDAGVSHYGARLVSRLNEFGIIVDTAHVGRQSTLELCELSTAPVVASHTAAESLYRHDRCKSDEEFAAIAATGGTIGVVTVPFFLASSEESPVTIEAMLDHIDYIANLVGWQHVSIGSDWPLGFSSFYLDKLFGIESMSRYGFRPEHDIQPTTNLVGFDDYRDFPNITRGLVHRGYTDEQVKGILGENFLRVFEAVCG